MSIKNEDETSFVVDSVSNKKLIISASLEGKPAYAIELDSEIAKANTGYSEIYFDLKEVLKLLFILDQNMEHTYKSEIDSSIYRSILSLYARCFRGAEQRRRVKLDKAWLADFPSELLTHHDFLTDTTNSHIAHAGKSNHFGSKTYLLWPKDITTTPFPFNIKYYEGEVKSRNDIEFISLTNDLASRLISKVEEKIDRLQEKIFQEVKDEKIEYWNAKAKQEYPIKFD
jgi:hypothetical protein